MLSLYHLRLSKQILIKTQVAAGKRLNYSEAEPFSALGMVVTFSLVFCRSGLYLSPSPAQYRKVRVIRNLELSRNTACFIETDTVWYLLLLYNASCGQNDGIPISQNESASLSVGSTISRPKLEQRLFTSQCLYPIKCRIKVKFCTKCVLFSLRKQCVDIF